MALIKCYECGKEHSDKAVACPNCGAPPIIPEHNISLGAIDSNKEAPPSRKSFKKIYVVVLLLVLSSAGIWFSYSANKNKPYNDCISIANTGFNWFKKGEDPKFITNTDMKSGYFCAQFPKIGGSTCVEDYCRQKYGAKQ